MRDNTTSSASNGRRRHAPGRGWQSAAERAQEAWSAPPPASGLWVSAEPAGAWTRVRELGEPESAATRAGARARASARAPLARAGGTGARVRAAQQPGRWVLLVTSGGARS